MTTTAPLALLEAAVEAFFAGPGAAWADAGGVVAFSGGADSTALATVLARRAQVRGLPLLAAHLDHGLDAGSPARALAAVRTAQRLGLPVSASRRPPLAGDRRAAGAEAAARRRRYRFLAEVARRHGATWVATAHHRDDQAETVVMRLLFGSGVEGLRGVRSVAGLAPGIALLRPLLEVSRREIEAGLAAAGLPWTDDPTNRDPTVPRNRVRHLLLPRLAAREGDDPARLVARLASLAGAAGGARSALARRLARRLDLQPAAESPPAIATGSPTAEPSEVPGRQPRTAVAASIDLAALSALPAELLPPALALLHRGAGLAYPPPAGARRELARQVGERSAGGAAGGRRPLACDAGGGWRWRDEAGRLTLRPVATTGPAGAAAFSYTLTVPGELEIAELGLRLRLERQTPAEWMLAGARERAGLSLPLVPGDRVVIRNRRRGDRLRPLGAAGTRRLKELLIDRQVPRSHRDRLPLLCLGPNGDEIAWVPGVTIEHRYRLADDADGVAVWVAEILPPASTAGAEAVGDKRGNRRLGATVGRSEVTTP